MSDYEELVERCENRIYHSSVLVSHNEAQLLARAILAEVLRTLETVTREMESAAFGAAIVPCYHRWLAMLHASPLVPPK